MPIYRCDYWALDIGDWLVEADGGTVLLTPIDDSAVLQLVTPDTDRGMTQQQLMSWANERVPTGIPIQAVECGHFSGVSYEVVDSEGEYFKEWLLSFAELVVMATYSCQRSKGTHCAAVDRMLSTLVDCRP